MYLKVVGSQNLTLQIKIENDKKTRLFIIYNYKTLLHCKQIVRLTKDGITILIKVSNLSSLYHLLQLAANDAKPNFLICFI